MSASRDTRSQDIIDRVEAAGLRIPAWQAVCSVLETLGEVLPYGTAAYLASSLPDSMGAEVGRHFPADSSASQVDRGDFVAAVARRCGCGVEEAERAVHAVTDAIAATVPFGVMVNVEHVTPEPLLDLITR
ncbi:hypothetical protein GCM10023322_22100 [Rugosimonospora acidiphila]|uniref:DUF2267 domain-containing protein n=1 Tax=Rugosimonospora acidiphila TaxID=556531 RepID=A0ABP9RRA3_9ACTN